MTPIKSALTPRVSLSMRKLNGLPLAFSVLLLTLLAGPTSASPLPTFHDPNLQACFDEQAAAQGWINAEDVRELVCVERGIRDIYGVDQLPLLESLDLSGNLIENLFPLNLSSGISLPNLVSLRLGDNRIFNIDSLEGYTGLHTLWLSGNAGIDFMQLRPIIEQNPDLTRLGLGDIDVHEPGLPWFNITPL